MAESALRLRWRGENHDIRRHTTIHIILILFLSIHIDRVLCESSYFYSRYTATWDEAKLDCEHIGGFLVQLDDMDELTHLSNRSGKMVLSDSNTDRSLWCGLKDDDGTNATYHWLDDTPLANPAMWAPGEPDGLTHLCGFMTNNNSIADGDCNSTINFMCEVQEGSELAQSRADLRSCYVANDLLRPVRDAVGYEVPKCQRKKTYFSPSHVKNFMTWSEADAFCKSGNGNLAKITSLEEQHIVDRFGKVKGFDTYWIGGTVSSTEGNYTWEDGQLVGGDGGWPDFAPAAEPAADPSKNCVTSVWDVQACDTPHPVLCEIDADLVPKHQSCYWKIAPHYWTTHRKQCADGGGNLANIKTIDHFELMLKFVNSYNLNIGMSDLSRTHTWTWMDGTMVMWSKWYGNTEPNSLTEDHAEYWYDRWGYNDGYNVVTNEALCEKTVFQFENADIFHTNDSITVTCHEPCLFMDRATTKTWTCADINVTSAAEGCICTKEGSWSILEPLLSVRDTSVLLDNDTDTCITVGSSFPVITLSFDQSIWGSFETEVVLSPDIEHFRRDIIRVFTSTDLSYPESTCQLSGDLFKCKRVSDSKFGCMCNQTCNVYVKLFKIKKTVLPLTLCELGVVKL